MSYRAATVAFGPPVYAPVSPVDDWVVAGVDSTKGRPSGVVILGAWGEASRGEVRTSDPDPHQPLFVRVVNVLCASVPPADLTPPYTLTVTQRQVDILVDGLLLEAQLLDTGAAWQVTAEIDGRVVSAAGRGAAPEQIQLARLSDPESLPAHRFRDDPRLREK